MRAVNDLDTPTGERETKTYATLAAQFAIAGHSLIKADPTSEGQAQYYAMRWNVAKPLADLNDARAYLAKLAGADRGAPIRS
jgi:hypothetical protein